MLKSLFAQGRKEDQVVQEMKRHIGLLSEGLTIFINAFENDDPAAMDDVVDKEREADSVRRNIISLIYEGAFLPYFRPSLAQFVEIVDNAFDLLEDDALDFEYVSRLMTAKMRDYCLQIARINCEMADMLSIAFEGLLRESDLREKTLAVRIYEKKVDEIKVDLIRHMRKTTVNNYWEGKGLSNFVDALSEISDVIEDASDHLHMINTRLR